MKDGPNSSCSHSLGQLFYSAQTRAWANSLHQPSAINMAPGNIHTAFGGNPCTSTQTPAAASHRLRHDPWWRHGLAHRLGLRRQHGLAHLGFRRQHGLAHLLASGGSTDSSYRGLGAHRSSSASLIVLELFPFSLSPICPHLSTMYLLVVVGAGPAQLHGCRWRSRQCLSH